MGKNIFHHQFTKLENARCRGGLWEPSNFVTSTTDRQLSDVETRIRPIDWKRIAHRVEDNVLGLILFRLRP